MFVLLCFVYFDLPICLLIFAYDHTCDPRDFGDWGGEGLVFFLLEDKQHPL